MNIAVLFSDANRVEFLTVEDELLTNSLTGEISPNDVATFLKERGLGKSQFFTFTKGDILIRNHYFGMDAAGDVTHSVEESELKKKAAPTRQELKLGGPINWSEIVSDEKNENQARKCVMYHDPSGYAVASCGYLLVWDRRAYEDNRKEQYFFVRPFAGYIRGVEYKCEKGDVRSVPELSKFNWAGFTSLSDKRKQDAGFGISMSELYNLVAKRLEALKEQYKKDLTNGVVKNNTTFKEYASGKDARARILLDVEGIGKVSFVLSAVQKFLRAAAALSTDDNVALRLAVQSSNDKYPDMVLARIEAERGGSLMTGTLLDERFAGTEFGSLGDPGNYGEPDMRLTLNNDNEEESDGMDLL